MRNDIFHGKLPLTSFQECKKINNIYYYIILFYVVVEGFSRKGLLSISHRNFFKSKNLQTTAYLIYFTNR